MNNWLYLLSTSAKELIIYMQIVFVMPYNVKNNPSKIVPIVLTCFQMLLPFEVYKPRLKFAEYVDILEQIVYANFKNEREKGNVHSRCTSITICK